MAKIINQKKAAAAAPITWHVDNVRTWKDGGITFALELVVAPERAVTIYGCRVATGKTGDNFISFPSRKGQDGKYYSHAYIRLTEEEQEAILLAVQGLLDD